MVLARSVLPPFECAYKRGHGGFFCSLFQICAYARTMKPHPIREGRAMSQNKILLKGGTLVTAYGHVPADLWIREGRIVRVAKDTLKKKYQAEREDVTETIFDASNYYILPGFLTLTTMQASRFRTVPAYIGQVRGQIEKGITCLVDTVQVEGWMKGQQLFYQLTPHFNSPIDYGIQLGLEAAQFNLENMREWCKQGFRLFQVTVRQPKDVQLIDWDSLYHLIHACKPCIQLRIAEESGLTAEQKKGIVETWLDDCQYGKVRTYIKGLDPFEAREREPFYHIALVEGEKCTKIFDYLEKNWYKYLPVIGLLDQLKLVQPKRARNPENLLSLLVRIASTNLAKAIGCYPQKGSLLPGADADLCLLQKNAWLTNFSVSTILNLSEKCLPALVMSKGRWVYRDGSFDPYIGTGKYVHDVKPYNYVI
jgi:hypothetical protein